MRGGIINKIRRVRMFYPLVLFLALLALPFPGGAQEPTLAVPIPTVKLSGLLKVGNQMVMPFIGQYIIGVYEYAAGVALVVAGVMVVIGGFQYQTAGGDSGRVGAAKSRIIDALIGALLVLGSYVLLNTIDPALTKTSDIVVSRVEPGTLAQIVFQKDGVPMSEMQPWDATPPQPTVEGVPAKDPVGNYIAQGACPVDMVPILESEDYIKKTKKKVEAFCIDRYEAPNAAGVRPFIGVADWEADWYCSASGKRLCTTEEWSRACLGPKGENIYGFGKEYIVGAYVGKKTSGPKKDLSGATYYSGGAFPTGKPKAPCNYDSGNVAPPNFIYSDNFTGFPPGGLKSEEESTLNPENPRLKNTTPLRVNMGSKAKPNIVLITYKELFDKVAGSLAKSGHEPSGSRPGCKTEEGVFDMIGNTQEIVVKMDSAKLTTAQRVAKGRSETTRSYAWMNGYWNPIWHLANPEARPTCTTTAGGGHAVNWRGHENGFRCCLNLKPPAK